MALSEKELLELKQQIQDSKESLSEKRGEEKSLMKRLKDEWGCSTLQAAKKKINKLKAEAEALDKEIEEKTTALRRFRKESVPGIVDHIILAVL